MDDSTAEQNIEIMDSETPAPKSEVLVPEKDDAPETSDRDSCTPLDTENVVIPNLTDDSTIWSAMNPDVSHNSFLQKGLKMFFEN